MGAQEPRNGRELLGDRGLAVVPVDARRWWVWVAAGVPMALVSVLLVRAEASSSVFSAAPWVGACVLAVVGWGYAARRAEARARAAFRSFQAAAVVGLAGHALYAYQYPIVDAGLIPTGAYLLLVPHVVIAAGAALVLTSRTRRVWMPRLATDATLLLLAALAAALRLVVEPALGAGAAWGFREILLTGLKTAMVVPVVLAAQVVLRRGTALSPRAGALLLVATGAFALSAVLSLMGPDGAYSLRNPYDYADLGGWLLFAAAGYSARAVPPTATAMLARRRVPDAVRKVVVPGAALFLAVAVADMGLGRPPRPETVLAVALLGVVLAIRTGHAFHLADRDAAQRRQLAHTRALVSVTHALAGTTDLDRTLEIISESARSVFGTRAAGIELLTEDGTALETRSAVGLPGDVLGLRFPIEGSFTGWVVQHQEARATTDPSRDPYIQPQSLSFLGRWPVAAAPIHFRGETLGALFACIRSEPFDAEELELMGAMAGQAAIAIQQARLFEQVTIMSVTDPLTGLANRRQLEHELPREFAAARRGRDLTAVIFDLDRFKQYNDCYGHLAGDKALQAFARSLEQETRAMNLAARYGGDEFVVILAGTDAAGAHSFIARVRRRFAAEVEKLGHGPVSVSAGLAPYSPEMADPEALLRAADDELYQAKPVTGAGG